MAAKYLQGVDPNSPSGKKAIAAGRATADGRAIVGQDWINKGYQQVPEGYSLVHGKLQPVQNKTAPNAGTAYNQFVSQNAPVVNDTQASNLASNLTSGYSKTSYAPKNAQDYIPPEILSQLGQVTSGFANYKPEKINVGKAQSMPVEYYQSQIDDLSKPLVAQYDKSRALARGDQAARGTLYDSEGYKDIGEIDKSYLDQLGSITRGVQQQRMQQDYAGEQDYLTRAQQESMDRRSMGLEGLTRGGALTSQLAGMYGQLGQGESDLATRTALQQAGIDANTINSLLGYGADRYGTEAGLFKDIYSADTDWNKALITDATERYKTDQQTPIDLLGLQGYTDSPQSQAYNQLLYRLGLASDPGPTGQGVGPDLPSPMNSVPGFKMKGPDGRTYRVDVDNYSGARSWVPV